MWPNKTQVSGEAKLKRHEAVLQSPRLQPQSLSGDESISRQSSLKLAFLPRYFTISTNSHSLFLEGTSSTSPIYIYTIYHNPLLHPLLKTPFPRFFSLYDSPPRHFLYLFFPISSLNLALYESKTMNPIKFYAFPIVGLVLLALLEGSRGQGIAPSPAPQGPFSDGSTIDQGIAYVLLVLALVITYLVHWFTFFFENVDVLIIFFFFYVFLCVLSNGNCSILFLYMYMSLCPTLKVYLI